MSNSRMLEVLEHGNHAVWTLKGSGICAKLLLGIDRLPCTNAETQTFCGNAWNAPMDAPDGIKGNKTDRNESRDNNAADWKAPVLRARVTPGGRHRSVAFVSVAGCRNRDTPC